MKWRMEPEAARKLADGLAAAVVVAIPWSTSAAYILMLVWAIVAVPNTDPADWRSVMKHPAAYLPVALVIFAAIGMLWAFGVPWPQRLEGFASLVKLLTIPVLLVQFRNSPRGHWVLLGFLASCTILLAVSWFQVVTGIKPLPRGGSTSYGVPVRDYIAQSQEFILCAIGLIYVAYMRLRERRWPFALGCAVLAALFFANVVFVAPSRTGLVTFPVLLLILVAAHMRISHTLGIACAIVVGLCGESGLSSPAVQKRILGIVTEVQDARTRHIVDLGRRAGRILDHLACDRGDGAGHRAWHRIDPPDVREGRDRITLEPAADHQPAQSDAERCDPARPRRRRAIVRDVAVAFSFVSCRGACRLGRNGGGCAKRHRFAVQQSPHRFHAVMDLHVRRGRRRRDGAESATAPPAESEAST